MDEFDDLEVTHFEDAELDMDMIDFQQKLWDLLTPHTENKENVYMASAIMLKTAVQLYTVVLRDEDIAAILSHEVIESIPQLRASLEQKLHGTIH
tara:strand:+ start:343 stop:627 length:285 start_codon:yes stop_codon:yes gene_type:complete